MTRWGEPEARSRRLVYNGAIHRIGPAPALAIHSFADVTPLRVVLIDRLPPRTDVPERTCTLLALHSMMETCAQRIPGGIRRATGSVSAASSSILGGPWFPSDGGGIAIQLPKHSARHESTGGQSHTYSPAGARTASICSRIPCKCAYA